MEKMHRIPRRLLASSRLSLFTGFGGLLVVIAWSGFDGVRVLGQIRTEHDLLRRQFLFVNHVLNDIRSELYLSGTYVRDFLLDPDPVQAEEFRLRLEKVRNTMEAALTSYAGQTDPAGASHYSALRMELTSYWDTLAPVLQWDAGERRRKGYSFLRDEVFPRRESMLRIAKQIEAINEQQLNEGNGRVVDLLTSFQTRLTLTFVIGLAIGLGMALFSSARILKLEGHAQTRLGELEQARTQLTNLSARLVEAQETERRSLSRELHDEVGQALSAVLVELRNLSTGFGTRSGQQLQHQVDGIRGLVEGAVRVIRNMALLLRPSMLDDLGLIPALRWQAREVSKRTSMEVSIITDLLEDGLSDEYKTCIYRVVQEALHNCSRHSRASTVQVRVQQIPDRLFLSVQDDGQGFDVSQTKGLGLLGIEERVSQLGGGCKVHSGPGIGTILTVELPFKGAPGRSPQQSEADSYSISG